ncbi:lipase member H isoform X1 [Megalopta genalis]|uniref:lipase member H isoform X1 n=1 Tax=Megalopta genalis TaxID=115081 RepID=UPI003FD32A18
MSKYRLAVIFAVSYFILQPTNSSSILNTIKMKLYLREPKPNKLSNDPYRNSYKEVYLGQAAELLQFMDLQEITLIHFHGYIQSTDTNDVVDLMQGYLVGTNYNVIAVDYRDITDLDYLEAVLLVDGVATVMVQTIYDMVAGGMNETKLILSGFSMGSQVCGFIGRKLSFQLSKIIAGDPAGSGFYVLEPSISASDALCVQCIHTDMGWYGHTGPCGHLDFYPNGGVRQQPGCPESFDCMILIHGGHTPLCSFRELISACSHDRADKYMAEAARHSEAFPSVECNSWDDFIHGKCDRNVTIPMGYAAPCSVTGKFYLQTNSRPPFSRGLNGTAYEDYVIRPLSSIIGVESNCR